MNSILTTAVGAYGDIFSSSAHISLLTTHTEMKKVNVLYYGLDETIVNFLELQDNIEKVIYIKPKNREEYMEIAKTSGNTEQMDWLYNIFPDAKNYSIFPTHLNAFCKTQELCIRHFNYNLPKTSIQIPKHSLLFNPYSCQSIPLRGHWHYIPDVLEYLIETDWNIILVGQEKYTNPKKGDIEFPLMINHPKIMNLVGKTSMLDVLSICEQVDGILTTSNSLSMFSIIINKPTIVFLNGMLDCPNKDSSFYYFKKWIDFPPNTLISYKEPLFTFKEKFLKWQQQLLEKSEVI